MEAVSLLILGAGWTSQFLIPRLKTAHITYGATTRNGRESTIPFTFDPSSHDPEPYAQLPSAETVLVTFPLTGQGQSKQITSLYRIVHGHNNKWIQLGSTGIFTDPHWNDHKSTYNRNSPRAIAEDELLELGGCVLNLAGLYGGERNPKNWVTRVAKTKQEVNGKKALHLIHGEDVARAIIAVHENFSEANRWLLTDLRVYDWWDLMQDWDSDVKSAVAKAEGEKAAAELKYAEWVGELMVEENVRSLPRSAENLGRVLDSVAFWKAMKIWPCRGRISMA
ncbi:hypothetical protein MMC07_007159 [Pseudocyphellaria aurata]|nr:hypothetical protein [Pseudocyphellaria aurata]